MHTGGRQMGVGLVVLAMLVGPSSAASGQDLDLSFSDGRVTLVARDITLPALLDAWSTVGGTEFVDAEGLPRDPLFLQLVDAPEPEALRIVLRGVAGYVAAPRPPEAGQSAFRRVIVMARSTRAGSAPAFVPSSRSSRSRLSPAQRGPRVLGSGPTDQIGVSEEEAIESLRELLPQPAAVFGRSGRDSETARPMPTATRPGMPVDSTDDAAPAFIRPVRPQDDDR